MEFSSIQKCLIILQQSLANLQNLNKKTKLRKKKNTFSQKKRNHRRIGMFLEKKKKEAAENLEASAKSSEKQWSWKWHCG